MEEGKIDESQIDQDPPLWISDIHRPLLQLPPQAQQKPAGIGKRRTPRRTSEEGSRTLPETRTFLLKERCFSKYVTYNTRDAMYCGSSNSLVATLQDLLQLRGSSIHHNTLLAVIKKMTLKGNTDLLDFKLDVERNGLSSPFFRQVLDEFQKRGKVYNFVSICEGGWRVLYSRVVLDKLLGNNLFLISSFFSHDD